MCDSNAGVAAYAQRYSAFREASSRLLMGKFLINKETILSKYNRLMIPMVYDGLTTFNGT